MDSRAKGDKLAAIERANVRRVAEAQLLAERGDFRDQAVYAGGHLPIRAVVADGALASDADARLGRQLEFGPRLAPHKGVDK